MSIELITGIIRHILTFGGGFLVATGWSDDATVTSITTDVTAILGAVSTVIGAFWSIKAKLPK